MPYCSHCGTKCPEEARFCGQCGVALGAPGAPPPPVPPPSRAQVSPLLWAVLAVLGLLVALLAVQAALVGRSTLQQRERGHVATAREQVAALEASQKAAATPPGPQIPVGDSTKPDQPPAAVPVDSVPVAEVKEGVPAGPVADGDRAAGLVVAIPDVQAWAAEVARARAQGKRREALLTVERTPEGDYLVHVFENVQDDEPGHTATYGWYRVNAQTGAVRNETLDSD